MAAGSSPAARPGQDFLIIPAAFHSKFMEYPRDFCLSTARLPSSHKSRGGGEEAEELRSLPRMPRVKKSCLSAHYRLLFTPEHQSPLVSYPAVSMRPECLFQSLIWSKSPQKHK